MNYSQIKKLDEDTQKSLVEGSGPADECLCSLLAPPDEPKGLRGSIKRAFASIGGRRPAGGGTARGAAGGAGARGGTGRGGGAVITSGGQNTIEIPLTFEKGGRGIFTTKEEVKRSTSCGKCGCDKEKFFLKHSYANIRITSPDVSSICPCPTSACMPGKEKLNNNISVTVEHVTLSDSDAEDYNTIVDETNDLTNYEENKPIIDKSSAKELVEHVWKEWKNREEEWNRSIEEESSEDAKTLDNKMKLNIFSTENDVFATDDLDYFNRTEEHDKTVTKKPNPEV